MQISVSGKQVDVGEALQTHVKESLSKVIQKYFENTVSAEVVFSVPSHKHLDHFRADILINQGGYIGVVKSNSSGDTAYFAFDGALEKMAHRLSKYNSKMKDHHRTKESINFAKANKYVLDHFEPDSDEDDLNIVTQKETDIESLTVTEAIMKMDLSDLPALLFKNKENDRINVVYHRADGKISWIDPASFND